MIDSYYFLSCYISMLKYLFFKSLLKIESNVVDQY